MAMNKTSSSRMLMICIAVTLTVSSFMVESVHGHGGSECEKKQQHHQLSGLKVEGYEFPATVKPTGSNKTLILGGAGVRGLQIKDKFIKFTTIGVYLDGNEAIPSLSTKWKGKSKKELMHSLDFFMDIVTGAFEKLTRVTMILPLTGPEYSAKVMENCVAYLKAKGTYTEAEAKAVEKFLDAFKNETCSPGSSIVFTQSPLGSLAIGFSKDSSLPEVPKAVIYNKPLAEAVLESIIGKNGVSPAAKRSLAARFSELLKEGTGKVLHGHTAKTHLGEMCS